MSPQAQLVILLWLPVTFFLFTRFPPRTAVITSFIGGLLFLPQKAGFSLPLIPDYTRMEATCYGIILGIIIYDAKSLTQFRCRWIDVPMLIWCICPVFSSLTNGLGLYDGINAALENIVRWGLPYFLGRLYLNNLTGLTELAISIVKGGLLYVPLCLFESRMSPQLHRIVYGFHPHSFLQSIRLGGFRPVVFMSHGLMVGMWMMLATLVIFWLWKANAIQQIWGIPTNWQVVILLITFILVRSTGAYLYLFYGLIVLFMAKWFRSQLALILLIIGICFYLFINISGQFNGEQIVAFVSNINAERAQSLEFRFDNEELLIDKARQKIVFGWGGWGRNRVYQTNRRGEVINTSITDSFWVITFGTRGVVGMISITVALLLPVLRFSLWGYPPKTWFNPKIAPAAVLGIGLVLFMVDCLLNAMFNPVFPLISGGLSGLSFKPVRSPRTKSRIKLSTVPARRPLTSARRGR